MNHVYRVVRNKKTGLWMVASEIARSAAGSTGAVVLASGMLAFPVVALAQSASAGMASGQAGRVYVAPNGRTTVVDINNASGAGLSHNMFTQFDVNSGGLVLNNANTQGTAITVNTQLAGELLVNMQLDKQATVILNEVVGGGQSGLNGFTEVAGQRAKVIIANPNGISVNGAGFINTSAVTLTTGSPQVAGGRLTSLSVSGGDIAVTGAGLNAKGVDVLNLLSRNLTLGGNINAEDLVVLTGAQKHSIGSDGFSVSGSSGSSASGATYAIDASSLGGMYADTIRLVSTDQGAGVRILSNVAASGGEFSLTAAGKIEIRGKISANKDLLVRTSSLATGPNPSDAALLFGNGSLSSKGDLEIVVGGKAILEGGELFASKQINIQAGELQDSSSQSTAEGNNNRTANGGVNVNVTGEAAISETIWTAGQDLTLAVGQLNASAANTQLNANQSVNLTATTGGMDLGQAKVVAYTNLNLNASTSIDVGAGATQGIQAKTGSMAIQTGTTLSNAGEIQAASMSNVNVGSGLTNSGSMVLSTASTAQDIVHVGANLVNQTTAVLLSAGDVQYTVAGSTSNAGTVQSQGSTTVQTNGLTQTSDGQIIGGVQDGKNVTVTSTGNINNAGLVQGDGNVSITASNLTQSGNVIAGAARVGDLTVSTGSGDVSNTGVMQASGGVNLAARNLTQTGSAQLLAEGQADHASQITLSGNLSNNASTVQAGGALALSAQAFEQIGASARFLGGMSNGGATQLNLSGGLDNQGIVQGGGDVDITAEGLLQQAGSRLIAGATATGDLSIDAGAQDLDNRGQIQASGALNVSARDYTQSAAATTLVDDANNSGSTIDLAGVLNNGNLLQTGGRLAINAASLNNSATASKIIAGKEHVSDLDVQLTGAMTNAGLLQSGGDTAIQASAFSQGTSAKVLAGATTAGGAIGGIELDVGTGNIQNDGLLQSSAGMDIAGHNFSNAGKVVAATSGAGSSQVQLTGTLTNNLLQAGAALNISAAALSQGTTGKILGSMQDSQGTTTIALNGSGTYVNSGTLFSGGDLALSAAAITNANGALVGSNGDTAITTTTGSLTNHGDLVSVGDMALNAATSISNLATTHTVQGRYLGMQGSTARYELKQVLDSKGTINAMGSLSMTAQNTVLNESEIRAGGMGAGNITITANTIRNEVKGGDSRAWTSVDTVTSDLPDAETTAENRGLDYVIDDEDNSYNNGDKHKITTYTETWHRDQYFTAGLAALKPLISGSGTVRLQNFTNGKNLGGVIEGANVLISTTKPGATFTNDALAVQRQNYTRETEYEIHYAALGPAKWSEGWTTNTTSSSLVGVNTSYGASIGASIRAPGAVSITGVAMTNAGSVLPSSGSTPGGGSAGSAPGTVNASGTDAGASGIATFVGVASLPRFDPLNWPGLNLSLPTSQNGYFVTSKNPSARYLVETNPLFTNNASLGSDYLADKLGIDPELSMKRLGDNNYEAYLVQQQLMAQTGSSLLAGLSGAGGVYQQLMENAFSTGGELGLTYGVAPTLEQLAKLTESIVWMVAVEVGGQTVLAPVVFLAPKTLASLKGGAEIEADQVTLNVTELMNKGGSIAGATSVSVNAKGDITNLSGSVMGGSVVLASVEGGITNATFVATAGDEGNMTTTLGKTAQIVATDSLKLDAKGDIQNLGAQMGAGGDASLNAGGAITFDTIEDKSSVSSVSSQSGFLSGGVTRNTTSTVNQVKSGLDVGGSLAMNAGKDITLAGTDADVGGDAQIAAGGDVNIVARENTVTSNTTSTMSGLGVGGGVYGTSETKTDSFSSRNVGSSLNIGGNADVKAGGDMTVQGSKLNVGGDAGLDVTNLNVLAGKDLDTTTTTTKTTSFLQVENVGNGPSSSSSSQSDSSKGSETSGQAGGAAASTSASTQAKASAGAGASYSDSAGVTLAKTTTTTDASLSQRSVGSELNLGGNVTIKAKDTVTLQGSELNAGGDLDLSAKNVQLLAAQNIEETSSTSTTIRLGLYATTENQAGASAEASAQTHGNADASASAGGTSASSQANASAGASANAGAQAAASSNNTVDVLRIDSRDSESLKVTNTGSAIRSGGDMKLDVAEKLSTVGSTIEAEGNVDLKAKEMSFEAAQDIDYAKESASSTRMGLYADVGTSAEAKAQASAGVDTSATAQAKVTGASAKAGGSAEVGVSAEVNAQAKIGVGLQAKDTRSTTEAGSSTAVTSSIVSKSGSVTRTAEGTIKDVGTNIEAATDFNQSATRIESLAAENSQFLNTTNEETTVRVGVYAASGADAKASASGSAQGTAKAGVTGAPSAKGSAEGSVNAQAGSEAVVGHEASMTRNVDSTASKSTQAVVSTVKVGGDVNSASKETTVLQGTQIEAGGAVNLSAAELEARAARDTAETTTSSETASAKLATKVGVGAKAEASASASGSSSGGGSGGGNAEAGAGIRVGASAEMGYENDQNRSASTTAVVSSISGNSININTTGKTTLEGTNLNAGDGGIMIAAKSLDYQAAQDTFETSGESIKVNASLTLEVTALASANIDAKAEASTAVGSSQSSGTRAVVGNINSAGGLNITTQGDTRLEGTQVAVAGDTNVAAGGSVKIDAARNTFQGSANEVSASVGFDKDATAGNVSVGVSKANENRSEAVVSNLGTGGSLNISAGNNVEIEGANIAAGGDAQLAAGGDLTFKEARNESTASANDVSVSLGARSKSSNNAETGNTTASKGGSAGVDVNVQSSQSSEAVTGSIKAGNNLTLASGGNATFVGTELAAGNSATVVAGGDVAFKAAESTRSSVGVGVGLAAAAESDTTTKTVNNTTNTTNTGNTGNTGNAANSTNTANTAGEFKKESSKEASGSLNLDAAVGQEQRGATLSAGAGGIQIASGGNVELQGTQMATDGAADISAAGKVIQTEATSSSVGLGVNVSGTAKSKKTTGTLVTDPAPAQGGAPAETDAGPKDAPGATSTGAESAEKTDKTGKVDPAEKVEKSGSAPEAESTDAKGAPPSAASAEANEETGDAKAEAPEPTSEGSVKKKSSLETSSESTETRIEAGGGTTIQSGVKPKSVIPGVVMTLKGSTQTDGTVKALVPIPGNLPAGSKVVALQPDGKPLPEWVKFDAATGAVTGTPPAGFEGGLNIVVSVPQADGSVRKVGVQF
ncbi:hemagglutinin repeat-containing protein [Hydrogenophaga sp. PAMC20947]|uniref:hemagglutinin repeat-containing protein n=1 Tax=Hydrogenophaga sp. PAMC20947 TaxID=2565558 RepID=UPI00109E0DE9|nr:hemagglutinin repeat-containing protein [Hydrogenophaga sp. PAMC20947]QCB45519.1 filamentous hemagglutinin N-terminal domain-containing protein [Hydrogenophaga sp. PAMC20947]